MKLFLGLIIMFFASLLPAQSIRNNVSQDKYHGENASLLLENLPDGVYSTYTSFNDKEPSDNRALIQRQNDTEELFSFYFAESNKKIKKAFAIVSKGLVYFQPKMMLKQSTTDSQGLICSAGSYFVKSELVGRFLYMEYCYVPASIVILGGLATAAVVLQNKPIMFVSHLNKFRVIKSFEHFKLFVDTKYPECSELVLSKEQMKSEAGQNKLGPVVKKILSKIK